MLFLLPFYIIKYEKSKKRLAEDDQYLQQMLEEYREIQESLVREQQEGSLLETASSCRDLISMIKRIADYIFRDTEKARKGVEKAMGGYLLELESEREAREKRECMEKGREEGRELELKKLIKKKLQKNKPVSVIADELEMDEAAVQELMEKI